MDLEPYDDLIGSIYDAALTGGSLVRMFHRIASAVNAESAGISVYDASDEMITHTLFGTRYPVSCRYLDRIRPLNDEASAKLVTSARPTQARRFTDIVPEPRLKSSRWYRLQTQLTGIGHGIVADTMISGIRIRLFVSRRSSIPNFDAREVDVVSRLSLHLGRGFTNNVRRFTPYGTPPELTTVIYHEERVAPVFVTTPADQVARKFGLTRTETRVLRCMIMGVTREIGATELGIGEASLKSHMRRIYAKTGARRLPDLMRLVQSAQPLPSGERLNLPS